mgnify:CR=1 FL=1
MTIELDRDLLLAEHQTLSLRAFMLAVGRAQASVLSEGFSFAEAEANSITLQTQNVDGDATSTLQIDDSAAITQRGRHGASWVYARLVELVASTARVRCSLVPLVGRGLAHGVTRANFGGHALPGRRYVRLPGPVAEVDVLVGAQRRRRGVVSSRDPLDIGRTLVHELVIHAWRDVSFYQPAPVPGQHRAEVREDSGHRAAPHSAAAPTGRLHNYADAEGDLIDLYWDIETQSRDPSAGHARRIARQVGGVLGTRILRWQIATAPRREQAETFRQERLRFLEQRLRFEESLRQLQGRGRGGR